MKIAFTNKRLLETLLIGGVNQKQILNANVAQTVMQSFM